MVRVTRGPEQQGSRFGDVRDLRWLWESAGLPCFLKTEGTGVTGSAQKEVPVVTVTMH